MRRGRGGSLASVARVSVDFSIFRLFASSLLLLLVGLSRVHSLALEREILIDR